MLLRKSTESEIEELTDISKRAFDTDVTVGGQENDGPPDYDSTLWHRQMMEEGHLFTYLTDEGKIVGGAVLFGEEELYVGRIFISPSFFRCGYGRKLMEDIEKQFSPKLVKLDTPVWNVRTNSFYKKCAYTETHRDADSVYYEKKL